MTNWLGVEFDVSEAFEVVECGDVVVVVVDAIVALGIGWVLVAGCIIGGGAAVDVVVVVGLEVGVVVVIIGARVAANKCSQSSEDVYIEREKNENKRCVA